MFQRWFFFVHVFYTLKHALSEVIEIVPPYHTLFWRNFGLAVLAFVFVLPVLILVDVVLNKLIIGHRKNSGDILVCCVYRACSELPVIPIKHNPAVFLRGWIVLVRLFNKLVTDVSKFWLQKFSWKVKGISYSATSFWLFSWCCFCVSGSTAE
jgi:hypothetical protein